MSAPGKSSEANEEVESEEGGLDSGHIRDLLGFLLRAPGRHKAIAASTFVVLLGLTVLAVLYWPRTYQVDVKILAQRPLVMNSLANPNRPIPGEADSPTKAVPDIILKHDNLVAVVKDTNLLDVWEAQRPPLMKLKEKIVRTFSAPPSEDDRMRALVGVLEQKLQVQADDQRITLTLQWENPQMAYDIISITLRNFLDGRSASDLAVIAETIIILEDEQTKQSQEVDSALGEVRRQRAKVEASGGTPTPPNPTGNPINNPPDKTGGGEKIAPSIPSPPKSNVAALLADKRKQIRELDEPRQKELADLRVQLAQLKTQYAPAHPAVIAMEEKVKQASVEPPELIKLKAEEQALMQEQDDTPPEYGDPSTPHPKSPKPLQPKPASTTQGGNAVIGPSGLVVKDEDPDLAQARARLSAATRKYQELSDRISAARIEMITAQAAFKYRYTVVQPAEFPKKPKKPNVPILAVGGAIAAILFALLAAALKDLASGRFVEVWQVQRRLKLPVLAQVRVR